MAAAFTSIFAAAARPAAAAAAALAARAPDSVVCVSSTANNIHACVSALGGAVIARTSGGVAGYKHRARASPEAARDIGEALARRAADAGYRLAHVHLKGPSRGRAQVRGGERDPLAAQRPQSRPRHFVCAP